MGLTEKKIRPIPTKSHKKTNFGILPIQIRRKNIYAEKTMILRVGNGMTLKFKWKPAISMEEKKGLGFLRDSLRPFFKGKKMVRSNDKGYVHCVNPRAVMHIFAADTCLECPYMANRSGPKTIQRALVKNNPKVYEACFKFSVEEIDYLRRLEKLPQIRVVMMGCAMGRSIPQKFFPKWHYLDEYRVEISNVRLDWQNKCLYFKFAIANMSRTLNMRTFDHGTNTWRMVRTIKNSILYLLDFFVEVEGLKSRKYFVEMPIVFKKGSPRKNKKNEEVVVLTCTKFEVDQYRPEIGSEKTQAQKLMNPFHSRPNATLQKIVAAPFSQLLSKVVVPLEQRNSAGNQIQLRLPSFREIINNPSYRTQPNIIYVPILVPCNFRNM